MSATDPNYFNQGFFDGGYPLYPQITFVIKTFDEIEFTSRNLPDLNRGSS